MKIIVTTSNAYHHLLPVFFYLYGKYCGLQCELVGYKQPPNLPEYCTFHSLGDQGDKYGFGSDLRKYFLHQPQWFLWLMDDTLLKAPMASLEHLELFPPSIGRIDLTGDIQKRPHTISAGTVIADPKSRYRLSTQPSVWNKDFLLKYMKPGQSPWDFETQDPMNDGWDVIGPTTPMIHHNEGVRRFDLYKLNLDKMCPVDIEHIKTIAPWLK